MSNLIQIRISLDYTHPEIYRVLVVQNDITFLDLHKIIQISMGWENQHLFGFMVDGYRIGEITDNFILGDNIINSRNTLLKDIVSIGDEFKYEYDFGDSWVHTIKIEEFDVEKTNLKQIPYCIKGRMKCPPENCGGIPGYFNFLNALTLSNIDFKNYLLRTGIFYESSKFSKVIVNRRLMNIEGYLKLLGDNLEDE
jgi:hypothetical protein